jgi:hypothetical protein
MLFRSLQIDAAETPIFRGMIGIIGIIIGPHPERR